MIRTINLDGYITPTRLSAASKADEAPYILITKSIKPEGANAFLSLGATASEEVPPIALIAYCTEAQHAGLVTYCKQHGINGFFKATHGRRIKIDFA